MKHFYSRILIFVLALVTLAPVASSSSLIYAAPQSKAQAQRQKQQAQKQKQREKQKAQQQKQREQKAKQKAREQAQKDKQRAREAERKDKVQAKKEEKNEQEAYRQQVEQIKKHNQRVTKSQLTDIHHYLGVWGFAGYSSLFQKFDTNLGLDWQDKAVGGFGGGAGLGYQLQYKHFLFNTGIEYEQYNSTNKLLGLNNGVISRSFGMSPYPTMTYTYLFGDFKSRTSVGYAQIPVLLGGEWNRYYFLAGANVGMSVMGKSANSTLLTTEIYDSELIIPLSDMLSHALVNDKAYNIKPETTNYDKMSFGLNVGVHAEVGIYLDEWLRPLFSPKQQKGVPARGKKNSSAADKMRFRLGVFADYGVMNIQTSKNITHASEMLPVLYNDATQPLDLTMVPTLSTGAAINAKVNPFMVGVKLAVFYELPRKQGKILPIPPEPLPRMATLVVDSATQKPLSGAMISVYNQDKQRTVTKTTNRTGMIVQKYKRGKYNIWAQRPGYFDSDTIEYDHQGDLQDTVIFVLSKIPAPPEYYLTGYVRDSETKQPLEAMMTIYDKSGKTVLYDGQASDDGLFVTPLKTGEYIAHLTMPGYMPQDDTISFGQDTIYLTLQRIIEGKKVVLHNMFFATNKTQILPESEDALEFLSTFMNENPSVEILITGHTDAVGSEQANQRLSEGRSKAVREALILRGVDGTRIETNGKGESEPIADNDTEEGRALNRRVEITITATGGEDIEQVVEVIENMNKPVRSNN